MQVVELEYSLKDGSHCSKYEHHVVTFTYWV
jgi:hypothetical protein